MENKDNIQKEEADKTLEKNKEKKRNSKIYILMLVLLILSIFSIGMACVLFSVNFITTNIIISIIVVNLLFLILTWATPSKCKLAKRIINILGICIISFFIYCSILLLFFAFIFLKACSRREFNTLLTPKIY